MRLKQKGRGWRRKSQQDTIKDRAREDADTSTYMSGKWQSDEGLEVEICWETREVKEPKPAEMRTILTVGTR